MTILTRFQDHAAIIILNRPERYNATDLKTIQEISIFLSKCAADNKVKRIIIASEHSKAFCVGGDIRAAYDIMKSDDLKKLSSVFFKEEYKLIYELANYPKPIISVVNGLCFGGGMGLSMHNKLRIITEKAVLGMPEAIIGFFPDVGASFRFAQFPKAWANFYGLTGNSIAIDHALKWNLADHFVLSKNLPILLKTLCTSEDLDQAVKQYSESIPSSTIFGNDWVDNVFHQNLKSIFTSLKIHRHPEAKKTLNDLLTRSPLSLLITNKLFELSASLDLKQSLQLDYNIAINFLVNSDFQEGIRAQIVDKDKNPQWTYTFDNIKDSMIEHFFKPLTGSCDSIESHIKSSH